MNRFAHLWPASQLWVLCLMQTRGCWEPSIYWRGNTNIIMVALNIARLGERWHVPAQCSLGHIVLAVEILTNNLNLYYPLTLRRTKCVVFTKILIYLVQLCILYYNICNTSSELWSLCNTFPFLQCMTRTKLTSVAPWLTAMSILVLLALIGSTVTSFWKQTAVNWPFLFCWVSTNYHHRHHHHLSSDWINST